MLLLALKIPNLFRFASIENWLQPGIIPWQQAHQHNNDQSKQPGNEPGAQTHKTQKTKIYDKTTENEHALPVAQRRRTPKQAYDAHGS